MTGQAGDQVAHVPKMPPSVGWPTTDARRASELGRLPLRRRFAIGRSYPPSRASHPATAGQPRVAASRRLSSTDVGSPIAGCAGGRRGCSIGARAGRALRGVRRCRRRVRPVGLASRRLVRARAARSRDRRSARHPRRRSARDKRGHRTVRGVRNLELPLDHLGRREGDCLGGSHPHAAVRDRLHARRDLAVADKRRGCDPRSLLRLGCCDRSGCGAVDGAFGRAARCIRGRALL